MKTLCAQGAGRFQQSFSAMAVRFRSALSAVSLTCGATAAATLIQKYSALPVMMTLQSTLTAEA